MAVLYRYSVEHLVRDTYHRVPRLTTRLSYPVADRPAHGLQPRFYVNDGRTYRDARGVVAHGFPGWRPTRYSNRLSNDNLQRPPRMRWDGSRWIFTVFTVSLGAHAVINEGPWRGRA